ncbi:hypothetical protein GIY56_12010 [Paracoccus sp. YIM 132242]|uniref:Uncharacterized protein n=1 Tax=Paracoccus lichenicola TaxID=2665644 RepID=A0A6L6HRV0_9RHOB|nr:hypothetical protein [Paracoccus lichenicola]MTE01020.1 hypothetical protein [Paracoccus lichenicola]
MTAPRTYESMGILFRFHAFPGYARTQDSRGSEKTLAVQQVQDFVDKADTKDDLVSGD